MTTQTHPPRPGFGFARRNGATLTGWHGEAAEVAYRDGVKPEVLAELRRYLGAPLQLTRHDAAGFERLLRSCTNRATMRARWLRISTATST